MLGNISLGAAVQAYKMAALRGITKDQVNPRPEISDLGVRERNRRYYTTSQLARRWGGSAVTVLRIIEQGDLNGLKIRGCYRICQGSIKSYESKVAF